MSDPSTGDVNPSTFAALVPEIAYDIIGRIPVGSELIAFILYDQGLVAKSDTWNGLLNAGGGFWAAAVLCLIGGGFIIGLPLSIWGFVLQTRFYGDFAWDNVPAHLRDATEKALQKSNDFGKWTDQRQRRLLLYSLTHDHVKMRSNYAAALLQKLSGEVVFCQTSAVAVVLACGLHLATHEFAWWKLGVAVAVLVALTWAAKKRYERLMTRQFVLFLDLPPPPATGGQRRSPRQPNTTWLLACVGSAKFGAAVPRRIEATATRLWASILSRRRWAARAEPSTHATPIRFGSPASAKRAAAASRPRWRPGSTPSADKARTPFALP